MGLLQAKGIYDSDALKFLDEGKARHLMGSNTHMVLRIMGHCQFSRDNRLIIEQTKWIRRVFRLYVQGNSSKYRCVPFHRNILSSLFLEKREPVLSEKQNETVDARS